MNTTNPVKHNGITGFVLCRAVRPGLTGGGRGRRRRVRRDGRRLGRPHRHPLAAVEREETDFYLCHKRLNVDDYFHPKNLVIDYYPRDVAEYFKYLFFSNNYHNFPFLTFLRQLHFSYDDFILLFARLIYPSYYFDCYDEIINNQAREEQLKPILLRTKEYIIFLANIYNIICQITLIPSVWWIKKETL